MKYIVCIWALDSYPEIELTKKEFIKIKNAKNCLSEALALEEKYEILLSNFLDLEQAHLNITSTYMIKGISGHRDLFDIQLLFNRKIVNLLTSTKLYIDQAQQHVKICSPLDKEIKTKVNSLFSEEYDSYFEYRFMEALRNYVQHKGLAVHSTSLRAKRIENEEDVELEYKTSVFTYKSYIEDDNAFKKQIIKEMPDTVDLIYASRVYIESISKIHNEIRGIISDNVEKSRNIIVEIIDEYKTINDGKSIGLHAVCLIPQEPNDEIVEKFPLVLEWDDIRLNLLKSNRNLINLKKRYVSSSYNKIE